MSSRMALIHGGPWRSGSAHVWGACGRWFESSRPDIFMSLKVYNSNSKSIEEFKPGGSQVTVYSCGPTVYNRVHIGNIRSFLFSDLLCKILDFLGYKVRHAINLTDIDDKTINGVKKTCDQPGIDDLRNYTEPFIKQFLEDFKLLELRDPEYMPRATDFISEMQNLVSSLLDKEFAYEKEGSVYFSIQRYEEYGKLSNVDKNFIKTGTRYNTDEYSKYDVRDFVLWKSEPETEKIAWSYTTGRGRPGWHLECSAMIQKVFKGPIDFHTGGVDLLFPHHENEIAQSCCGYGHHFVRYWMHCEHLQVDGQKMSKSLGNVYTLPEIMEKGYSARDLKLFMLTNHYRQKLNFTWKALKQTKASRERFVELNKRLERVTVTKDAPDLEWHTDYLENFTAELAMDLNTPRAYAVMHEFAKFLHQKLDTGEESLKKIDYDKAIQLLAKFSEIFPVLDSTDKKVEAPKELKEKLDKRQLARREKNYALADQFRLEIESAGYKIIDTNQGSFLEKES
jgi:cysteinyl-tRNA synthetase